MKNTIQETYGNNYPSAKIKRILVPLFTQENPIITEGLKYFFPENPEIDRLNIIGMEVNLVPETRGGLNIPGDITSTEFNLVRQKLADSLYLVMYNSNNEELFYNLPVRSLFTIDPANTTTNKLIKRIKPILAKIKTRSCYCYCPANITIPNYNRIYLSLTFFYN
jgi:hypothetical protein